VKKLILNYETIAAFEGFQGFPSKAFIKAESMMIEAIISL